MQGLAEAHNAVIRTNVAPYEGVAAGLLAAWRRAHGTENGQAHVMAGPTGLAVFIEEAFSRAELTLAGRREGHALLNRYVGSLLEEVCREQTAAVAEVAQRPVVSTGASLDPQAGWVMVVFKFA